MSQDAVIYEVSGAVATITLNRPDRLNALGEAVTLGLTKAVNEAAGDRGVRAVIITGAGRAFCSGADLADIKPYYERGEVPDLAAHLRNDYHPIIETILEMEKPVIGAVNGIAAGAGSSLALATDIVLAAEGSAFMQAFIRIGLIPDSGANHLLPHLVGLRKALELGMLGDPIGAADAERFGLVNRVVPDDRLMDEARAMATRLAEGPTRALAATRRIMRFGAVNSLRDTLEFEADLQAQLGLTADHTEGVTAFLEKRQATFEGR
jgi:2-(1,2-epoxy-1,2-dihydrophenyl)acetyl-CoA isomerase